MPATPPRYFVGLDLGPTGQFTALAILELSLVEEPAPVGTVAFRYALRHLQRFDPGTPYATIIAAVRELLSTPALQHSLLGVDQTGVGRVVKAALLAGLQGQVEALLIPVTLTTGLKVLRGGSAGFLVPKLELITSLQLVLQARHLVVPSTLPDAALLVRELETFRLQPKLAGGEDETAWRAGANDDLVLAMGLAVWLAEQFRKKSH